MLADARDQLRLLASPLALELLTLADGYRLGLPPDDAVRREAAALAASHEKATAAPTTAASASAASAAPPDVSSSAAAFTAAAERRPQPWRRAVPPLPAHAGEPARAGAGALYAALRTTRYCVLARSIRRWAAAASSLTAAAGQAQAVEAELSRLRKELRLAQAALAHERQHSAALARQLHEAADAGAADGAWAAAAEEAEARAEAEAEAQPSEPSGLGLVGEAYASPPGHETLLPPSLRQPSSVGSTENDDVQEFSLASPVGNTAVPTMHATPDLGVEQRIAELEQREELEARAIAAARLATPRSRAAGGAGGAGGRGVGSARRASPVTK